MTIRNRELSQFGSFIYVENSTQEIGITTGALPYVGIGTTNPQFKLDVNGDTNIVGLLTVGGAINASSFFLNGNPLINASVELWSSGTGSDIYRLNGNVGIGTSVTTEKLTVLGNVSVSGNVSASRFISTVSSGTAPFTVTSTTEVTNLNASLLRGGVPGQNINSFDIVTNGGTQTLTNKTLTLPTFSGTGVVFNGSSSGVTTVRASASASGIVVIPAVSGIATVITSGDTGTVTSNMIADLNITNVDIASTAGITYGKLSLTNSIVNADIASGAAIAVSKLASSTISGVSLGSNLNNLTAGSFITYNSGTTYNGSAAITVSVAATTASTGNTLVARNSSGDFTAGTVSVTNLTASTTVQANNLNVTQVTATNGNFSGIVTAGTISVTNLTASTTVQANNLNVTQVTATNGNFSGIVTATDFNSTSDINLKTNIHTVENALETVSSLRGVSFDWKETGKSSYGVIAQELEKILPELVNQGETKSVNYNGIIGVLIEAVKELSAEVEELKSKVL
jgi:hypothetical protein